MEQDLTLSEVLVDPLIAQLRKADHVGYAAFAQLMESAARVNKRRLVAHLHEERADAFYRRVDVLSEKNRLI
ncbi:MULTISPECIES: hypothetical protein [Rhizobium/Agrobacterium group]|uniref:Uncharacterized protein n=2 Tax=Neorhizobium TaxID=1525371 RepID=A0ABV0LZN9_9HYPH|nr:MULTISPECIES: hypothetical protein [Rhizobium/Agrobacterium group]KGE01182.1 hypothetical protein JL39_08575 [Rhizobium sp. YS-1r]MCC2610761.1 hypothetical protein [Neorhizobium petrolearium]WGI70884.1 hypothetical protein QEO92_12995 [Neorhizobium petrolearium]